MSNEITPAVWPYDEVTISQGTTAHEYIFNSPWLSVRVNISEAHAERISSIVNKLSAGTLAGDDFQDVSWLYSHVKSYPLCYFLPTPRNDKYLDTHQVTGTSIKSDSGSEALLKLSNGMANSECKNRLRRLSSEDYFKQTWTWDVDSSLTLSRLESGYDPLTLLSTSRRFHLLESLETNKTDQLNSYMRSISSDSKRFSTASALVVRQNHFVTQMCDSTLRAGLKTSQSADHQLIEFIDAESGHDEILGKALEKLGQSAADVPVLESVALLMDLFKLVAQKNYLAFCMILDMFERSSYQEHDPLAELLIEGGQKSAGLQIDIHKEINDSGGHENMAIGLLSSVAPVDAEYAEEALRLAELATRAMYFFSSDLLHQVKEV